MRVSATAPEVNILRTTPDRQTVVAVLNVVVLEEKICPSGRESC